MARRPPGMGRQEWLEQRAQVWRRRNRVFNVLMVAAIVLVVVRFCGQTA